LPPPPSGCAIAYRVLTVLFGRLFFKKSTDIRIQTTQMILEKPNYRNYILKSLSDDERASIEPALEPVTLDFRFQIEIANKPIPHVYFLESGIASTVGAVMRGRQIELGIVGREGMTGVSVVLGGNQSPYECFMQMGGTGFRISSEQLTMAIDASPSLGAKLLTFAQTFLTQVASTAQTNGHATLETRLARWLLMVHDRADEDMLPITHEFLAVMVGVRRSGITVALHKLEGDHMIQSKRGRVLVRDRQKLVEFAKGFYGSAEQEYARLTGQPLSKHAIGAGDFQS